MEFHEKLQELRKSRGMTQEELAAALFVSRTAISKWESGVCLPDVSLFRTFAGTENEKVMNSLFSSLNRNYGVLEYSNDSGSKRLRLLTRST